MSANRGSGVLLHISSLPSCYGAGDLGLEAYKFVDFLVKAKQSYWQILPLTPTEGKYGNSPYSSPSAFAGNSLFISPELLYRKRFLKKSDIKSSLTFAKKKTDYKKAALFKKKILRKAFENYQRKKIQQKAFKRFCSENSYWLKDYALFSFLKNKYREKFWNQWPEDIRDRKLSVLEKVQKENSLEIEERKFVQFLFYSQWFALKEHCQKNKISIIGDIPIYVNFNSAEVWRNPRLFKLDDRLKPGFVAGVPPDYFSRTGQRWGTPVYHWQALKRQNYAWWLKRIEHNLRLYDYVRIDHFRGFVAYWQIPAEKKTAVRGKWIKVPARDFFSKVRAKFPGARIIAEDVGYITPAVRKLIKDMGFPGTKILQFAFSDSRYNKEYLPSNYPKNCVAYTGTHDNNTIRGWFFKEISFKQRLMILKQIGDKVEGKKIHWKLIELLMKSKANIVIIPLQDILGLGEEAKMNKPATTSGNWQWRLNDVNFKGEIIKKLKGLVILSKRNH